MLCIIMNRNSNIFFLLVYFDDVAPYYKRLRILVLGYPSVISYPEYDILLKLEYDILLKLSGYNLGLYGLL